MAKRQGGFRFSDVTFQKIKDLCKETGLNQTSLLVTLVNKEHERVCVSKNNEEGSRVPAVNS